MTTNHKPEYRITPKGRVIARDCGQNAEEYIRRANAYPRLVDLAQAVVTAYGKTLLPNHTEKHLLDGASAILRELGEKP